MFSNFFNLLFNDLQGRSLKRQSRVRSDETTKTNSKYESDIEALKQRYGDSFSTGLCIEVSLKEILELCPRERRRTDSYQGLVSYLKSRYGVTLRIHSQKSKQTL